MFSSIIVLCAVQCSVSWMLKDQVFRPAAYLDCVYHGISGHISLLSPPYLSLTRVISLIWQTFPIEPKTMFKPGNVVGARAVELLAGHIAERIGLQLSPVNYHALSARLLHAMKLPVEKLSVYTHRIYEWYCPAGLWLTSKESALPTRVYVMAMIIIVLKVLYKLDGRIENPISDSEAAPNAMNGETFFNNRDSQGAGNDSPDDKEVDSDGGYYSEADVTSRRKKKNGMDEKDINSVADLASGKANELEEVWDVKKLIMCMKKMKPFRNKINESKP